MIVIELNDASITIMREAQIIRRSPGYARLVEGEFSFGDVALHSACLLPSQTFNHFWDSLNLESITLSRGLLKRKQTFSNADLAASHLESVLPEEWRKEPVVFAIPGHYVGEQVAILMDLAKRAGFYVIAMVDSALLAATDIYPHEQLLYLDLSLHRTSISVFQQDTQRRVEGCELITRGLLSIRRRWVEVIARNFVRATRFNPFHKAETEQALYDQLPYWLDRLCKKPVVELSLTAGGHRHRVMQSREDLELAAQPFYDEVIFAIERLRDRKRPTVLNLSHRICALPGLIDLLQERLADCSVVPLQEGAAGQAAFRHAEYISENTAGGFLSVLPCYQPFPAELETCQSTHLVYRGMGFPVADKPLLAVRDEQNNGRIRLVTETTGDDLFQVSRRNDGQLQLALLNGDAWLNGKPVEAISRLQTGDKIRLFGGTDEITVISLVEL